MFKLQVILTLSIYLGIDAMNVGFISKGEPLDLEEVISLNARRSKPGSLFPKSRILENVKVDFSELRGLGYRRASLVDPSKMNGIFYNNQECTEGECETVCEDKYDYDSGTCAEAEWCICFN